MGEVGLCGEIRAIGQVQRRINECERLGYNKILLSKSQKHKVKASIGTELIFADTISQALVMSL